MNGLAGSVTEFKYLNNAISVAYVKLNNNIAGLVGRQLDETARQHHWVPLGTVKRGLVSLKTGNSDHSKNTVSFNTAIHFLFLGHDSSQSTRSQFG